MPLFHRVDGALVDILIKRFDDVDVFRLARRTHDKSDQHGAGDTKSFVVVRLVLRRDLVGDAGWGNPRADIPNLLVVGRAGQGGGQHSRCDQ
jgi:hypothetical protein